ncbi:MAG TPA: hypothetical protein VFW17_19505 [Ktedonobacterales bacterium]|nr:hypothetical protein [Ktedonobacterales bacterium]
MMVSGQSSSARAFLAILRTICPGAMLCLCALAWFAGQAPAVHAAGVPYCGKLADERSPTRPAIHLNRGEGPVGTDLTVATSGWHPGAHVALHFDARDPKTHELYTLNPDFAQGTVAKDGTIMLSSLDAPAFFCVDMSTPDYTDYRFDGQGGATAYFVLASDHGEVSAPVAFRYLAAPTIGAQGVDPAFHDTRVGSTIIVTGSGWEPGELLTLTLRQPAGSYASVPYSTQGHTTTDAQGNFTASYPLDARLHWGRDVMLTVEGSGPRFGSLTAQDPITLLPAIHPTFHIDHTLVTPGMTIMVSGEHWFPGDVISLKLCDSQMVDGVWSIGPNCGKAAWPVLTEIPIDAGGRMRQQIRIPAATPLGESIFIVEVDSRTGVQPIPVHVVDHLPTWDDIHPRVAALRNKLVGSLPFTIPAALALGALAFFAIRRWRVRHAPRV